MSTQTQTSLNALADLIADAIRRRPESIRFYVTSAEFKMHMETLTPVMAEVQAELRALPLPEPKVTECLRSIVDRVLAKMEGHAAEGELRSRVMLEELARRPVPQIIQ